MRAVPHMVLIPISQFSCVLWAFSFALWDWKCRQPLKEALEPGFWSDLSM